MGLSPTPLLGCTQKPTRSCGTGMSEIEVGRTVPLIPHHSGSWFPRAPSGALRTHTPVLRLLSSQSRFPPSVHFPDGRIPTQSESRFIWLPQRRRSVFNIVKMLTRVQWFPKQCAPKYCTIWLPYLVRKLTPHRGSTLLGILQLFFFVDRNCFLPNMGG